METGSTYLIIGCGVFGLTTGLTLSKRDPQCRITMIDRYEPPVPDGASVDTSRIIRADYGDRVYAELAREAQRHWRTDPDLKKAYHECGMLLNTADDLCEPGYLEKCIENVKGLGIDVEELQGAALMEKVLGCGPGEARDCSLRGYLNPVSGFADSGMGIEILYARAKERDNIHFHFEEVIGLSYAPRSDGAARRAVVGAEMVSGRKVVRDTTILASGAWQLPDLPVPSVATGQAIGYIDLTEEEVQKYSSMPITINFCTGWFCIPPYKGHLKVARHAEGYLNTSTLTDRDGNTRVLSVPRTSVTHGNQQVPDEGQAALREGLRTYLPELADRPFSNTRVCWYTDTPLSDFIIDWYPQVDKLFVATGGSGHGYKFLPILGDLIVSVLDGTVNPELRKKWSFEEALAAQKNIGLKGDGSRGRGRHLEWSEVSQQ
ncbi:Putative uncharacterized protein [Taphrina deformans PYCC 5710]|uniref:FAD dependent oxidoreductase domain-containing protein n=1 Tax=Taphrina deformans (strain PYCC 5710 / ATCC 11124 / CBS 356.35 / IMI 108563 / JCM 9778 / NBRC 8474) TaxID=1097556 RepID=R4XBR8_TAPDE|nr:Putative uncharacterized protein [Taphrina deformans PYCC 5710]|eukprot:CCG80778.1 Putative uncharacterized protein [Taphrina deformans PYCC 5710]